MLVNNRSCKGATLVGTKATAFVSRRAASLSWLDSYLGDEGKGYGYVGFRRSEHSLGAEEGITEVVGAVFTDVLRRAAPRNLPAGPLTRIFPSYIIQI